jgi:hypothetical protein
MYSHSQHQIEICGLRVEFSVRKPREALQDCLG